MLYVLLLVLYVLFFAVATCSVKRREHFHRHGTI